jgi:hypothetical protein
MINDPGKHEVKSKVSAVIIKPRELLWRYFSLVIPGRPKAGPGIQRDRYWRFWIPGSFALLASRNDRVEIAA